MTRLALPRAALAFLCLALLALGAPYGASAASPSTRSKTVSPVPGSVLAAEEAALRRQRRQQRSGKPAAAFGVKKTTSTAATTPPATVTTSATPAPASESAAAASIAAAQKEAVEAQKRALQVKSSASAKPHSGSSKLSGAALALAILGGLLALCAVVWAIFRFAVIEPHWLLSVRHALSEAGFRASAVWAEFSDWARLGH